MRRAVASLALALAAALTACGVKAPPRPPAPEKPRTTSPATSGPTATPAPTSTDAQRER